MSVSRKPQKPLTLERRNLPLLMLQSREHLMAYFRPILNSQGITEQQWRVIRVLHESGPLEPRMIGERCRLSSPSLAGVLARMEQMDLVTRKRWIDDQRRVHVALTARARSVAAHTIPHIEAAYQRVERQLGKRLCDALYGALDAVVEKLPPPSSGRETDPAAEEDDSDPKKYR